MTGHAFKQYPPYTCLMSLYSGDDPDNLRVALQSITSQTVLPSELLIVVDGPISEELECALSESTRDIKDRLKTVRLPANRGLWFALQTGVEHSANELIMRMDSDDYSEPDRAEIQLEYMQNNPGCDCCGSVVTEFKDNIDNIICRVDLPEAHDDIVAFSKRRDPIRHPTLLYKKSDVIESGNYQDMPYFEDYDLVFRLIEKGCTFHNLQKPLVRVRVSDDFYQRRGDISYLKHMLKFRSYAYKRGHVTLLQLIITTVPHTVVCILPNKLRELIYLHLLRKKDE